MHVEIQVALNFLISFLYNKLPRRRVNQFGEELENALKLKFEGHWYPEKPYKGSAFRCVKTTPPLDPVFEIAARESGMDIVDIQENLPQELSIWIDPGEVSYRMSEKGPVKILYSESDRPHDLENSDREVIRTFNPEAQCFKPIEATAMAFGSLSLGPGSTSPSSLHVIPNGFPSSPNGNTNGSNSSAVAAAAVVAAAVGNGNGSTGNGSNNQPNGVNNLINPVTSVTSSPIYKSFTTGSMGPSGFLPKPSSSNVTFTTATFAQTKFGSTKLKSNTKRSHRMSPTEFSNYIKQRALQQQQQAATAASVVGISPNGNDRSDRGGLSSGLVNGVHSPSGLNYVHGSPNGTGLSSGNISPQNSRSMSPIGSSITGNGGSLDSVSNLLFMGNHSVCTSATSPITHSPSSSLSSFYSGNHGAGGLVGSSMGHGSISPRHHPSHHQSSHNSGLSSSLNGLYGTSSSNHNIDSQLADLLGSSSLLPKSSSPSMSNGNSNTSSNNNVFNRFASLFDKGSVGSNSTNLYLSNSNSNNSPTNGNNTNTSNIITSVANNASSNTSNNLINIINNTNNTNSLHTILNGDTSSISSQCFNSNSILGSSALQVNSLYGNNAPTDLNSGLGSNVSLSDSVSPSSSSPSTPPSTISLSATSIASPAASSPTIAVPSSSSASSSFSTSASSSTSSSPSSSSMPSTSPVPAIAGASASSSSASASANNSTSNKGFDSFSFSLNGVSYPNQYQHLLVAN